MSWKAADVVTTTFGTIQQATTEAFEAGVKAERERILRLLDDEADKGPVNWLIALITKDAK